MARALARATEPESKKWVVERVRCVCPNWNDALACSAWVFAYQLRGKRAKVQTCEFILPLAAAATATCNGANDDDDGDSDDAASAAATAGRTVALTVGKIKNSKKEKGKATTRLVKWATSEARCVSPSLSLSLCLYLTQFYSLCAVPVCVCVGSAY